MFNSKQPHRRVRSIGRALLAGLGALALMSCKSAALPDGQIKIEQGVLTGISDGGITSYLGIEYARAERWALPESGPNWDGVKVADTLGPACPQAGQAQMIEDCLFVNVFTPSAPDPNALKPVMVWIHGGGFKMGEGGDIPKSFAMDDIVVVTFNYRLGRLGFRDWPGWDESDPRNFGQADMVKALEWTRDNIRAFGGDPDTVTIAGHSAGGMGVQLMMLDPRAEGLFARAIAHSGYGTWPFPKAMNPSPEERQRIRYGALETKLSPKDLVAQVPYFHLPYIGGSDLPQQPSQMFDQGGQKSVPYMAGANSFDGFGVLEGAGFKPGSFLARYAGKDLINLAYADDFMVSADRAVYRLFGDMRYVFSAWQTVKAMAKVNAPGYLFYYDEHKEGEPGANHTSHYVPLFYKSPSPPMRQYYVNFIKTGDPNVERLPAWSPNTEAADTWMVLSPEAKAVSGKLTEKMKVIETLTFPEPNQ